jgi:predicted PurR-regulated permease PerM
MSDAPEPRPEVRPFAPRTRELWFYAALLGSVVFVGWLLAPYASVLVLAVTLVVITWPIYAGFLVQVNGNRAIAAVGTFLLLALLVGGPVGWIMYRFAIEALGVVQSVIDGVQSGAWEAGLRSWLDGVRTPGVNEWIGMWLPADSDLVSEALEPLRNATLSGLQAIAAGLPGMLNAVVGGGISAFVFVFATITLYMEGPGVLEVIENLSPVDDRYGRKLFHVFQEFSRTLVLGSLGIAAIQGGVASTGYAIAGADRALFFGILTGLMSFVPVLGTMVVWIPVAIEVAIHRGAGHAVFVVLWSIFVTGLVDNLLKPFVLRGSSGMHPLLVFLAVLGGLQLMGLPGVIIGPVGIAFFMALYRIYCEEFLGLPPPPTVPESPPGWRVRLAKRWRAWLASWRRPRSPAS